MVDKNLFLHDLAVVAILKNEAPYLKEWLDYHLAAGVDHFYLYDNESPDNQAEVAKPYVEAGLVDYFPAPGKVMQMPVYNDAVKQFRFFCRYMAFVDIDEFIYPKNGKSIVDVVDEILSQAPDAAGLAIKWQMFGSNGHEKADYSRGVLERFTRRAASDWAPNGKGNAHVKTISNPRKIHYISNPHFAKYFKPLFPVNENAQRLNGTINAFNEPVSVEKIAVNHYYVKSREEFLAKIKRGRCDQPRNDYDIRFFEYGDCNEVFDDGILKYRAARADNFSVESTESKIRRVTKALAKILSRYASGESFDLEVALTCCALSNYLCEKFPVDADYWKIYEEASLAAILKSLDKITRAEGRLFIFELPFLLRLPYSIVDEIHFIAPQIFSQLMDDARLNVDWREFIMLDSLREALQQ